MLAEVVAERDRVDFAQLPDDVTFRDLRGLGRHNVDTGLHTRLFAVLTAESFDGDEPLHEFFVERYATSRTFVRSLLERERLRGAVRADVDIDQLAREVTSVAIGAEIQWLLDPGDVDLATVFETYIDGVVDAIAPVEIEQEKVRGSRTSNKR